MKCSVDNCLNETRTTKKSHGITFHLFPKEPLLRGAWMDALGLTGCESREPSVVCSDHFRGEDFFERGGLRMIKKGALPFRAMESEVDLDVPASLRVCRICLATDSTMYDIKESNLDQQYQQITGIFSSLEDRLPQRLCWECGHRLKSAISFKNKAVRAHDILVQMLSSTSYITLRDIKTINRIQHNLKSTLVERSLQKHNINPNTIKIIKCESYNDNDNEYNDKEYNNKDCKDSENNDNECIIDTEKKNDADNEYNDYEYIDNGYNDNEVEKLENIIKVEIKHEPRDDMFYEECNVDDDTESEDEDDNKKLSEIYPHIMEREKASVKKRKIVEKKVRVVKKKEDGDGVKKKKDGISMLDKYKTKLMQQRKVGDNLEKLFVKTTPTYNEQIAEIKMRQDKMSYKNAQYKCTVCFKGFNVKGDYDTHIFKHSEQAGAYECFICKARLKSSQALWKHQASLHMEKFSCRKCAFITRSRDVARKHARWHSGTTYKCPHCPATFEKFSTYMGHIRIKHVSNFVCELCGFTFVSKRGIEVHKNKTHKLHDPNTELSGPYCDLCDVKFVSEDAHSRHLQLSARHSSDNNPHKIRNDSRKMRVTQNSKERRANSPRPSIHPRNEARVSIHPRGEGGKEGKGPVTCEQCGVQSRDFRRYVSHFKEAHPDKNRTKFPDMETSCMCEQCGKIFPSVATLKDHFIWVHTGEKRYKCAHCPKSYTKKPGLVLHEQRVHSATRPSFECDICGKHFAYYSNMKRHVVIHSGLKSHKCQSCGKCFTTPGELRSHYDHVHLKKPWPQRTGRHRKTGLGNTEY